MKVRLKVLTGSHAGRTIKVSVPKFLIGRDESCHLRPSSELISRRHCALLTTGLGVEVRDLKSRNGVFVNDERIVGDRKLATGDKLKIGKLEFEVQLVVPQPQTTDSGPQQSANQTSAKATDSTSDIDISLWLDEGDEIDRRRRAASPDTRQFKLDETDRVRLEGEESENEDDSSLEEEVAALKKQKPGKLPKNTESVGIDSGEAASDMLKKFFNRR